MNDHFYALALQTRCDAINQLSEDTARQRMRESIERIAVEVRASKGFIGPDVRLVVLPEYFLTGFPMGDPVDVWARKAAISPGGPEYTALGEIATANDLFLSGNVYERDTNFSDLYFQTSFVLNPSGDVVLRYRRLISMFAPTPHDVWDRYLDLYGADAVFPVADTEIGKLAACASEEILYPEIVRAHALKGAEIILHSTSEVGSPELTPKDIAKRARAIENLVYVVSANSAAISDAGIPKDSTNGMSKIVDYKGLVLANAGVGESMVANAELDLTALRRHRHRTGMANTLARQRLELFASAYGDHSVYPANTLLDNDGNHVVPKREHFIRTQQSVIETLSKSGLI